MDSRDEAQRALREMVDEIGRAADQAKKMARQIAEDVGGFVGLPEKLRLHQGQTGGAGQVSVADAIRDLAALHQEGLITEAEYQAKKSELLGRL